MRTPTRSLAAVELLLILPAVLFMAALAGRYLPPAGNQLAVTAQQIVTWYASRMWTLWVLLLALPILVTASGLTTLYHFWNREPRGAARPLFPSLRRLSAEFLIAATTLASAGILAIVTLHMAAN